MTETYPYLKSAVASVCPSRSEAGGIINFAAQAAGTVPIGSNTGGIPEYIQDKETGLLFASEDVEDISRTMERLIVDKPLRQKLVENGHKNIQQYKWTTIGDHLLDRYLSLKGSKRNHDFQPWSNLTKKMWKLIK